MGAGIQELTDGEATHVRANDTAAAVRAERRLGRRLEHGHDSPVSALRLQRRLPRQRRTLFGDVRERIQKLERNEARRALALADRASLASQVRSRHPTRPDTLEKLIGTQKPRELLRHVFMCRSPADSEQGRRRLTLSPRAASQLRVKAPLTLLLLAAGVLWFWSLRRSAVLFVVRVRDGEATLQRGRIPPPLLSDIKDIMKRAGVRRAELQCKVSGGAPTLSWRGDVSADVAQQLRNVVGRFSVAALRRGRPR